MAAKPRIPSYCLHMPDGTAIVKAGDKIIYPGAHTSDEIHENYTCVVADVFANGPVREPTP